MSLTLSKLSWKLWATSLKLGARGTAMTPQKAMTSLTSLVTPKSWVCGFHIGIPSLLKEDIQIGGKMDSQKPSVTIVKQVKTGDRSDSKQCSNIFFSESWMKRISSSKPCLNLTVGRYDSPRSMDYTNEVAAFHASTFYLAGVLLLYCVMHRYYM